MSKEEKREIRVGRMSDFAASGLSQKEWCRQNQVPLPQFGYWRRALKQQATTEGREATSGPAGWLHVELPVGPEQALDPQRAVGSSVTAGLTVGAGGASIEVHACFDALLLRAVVQALSGAEGR